MMLAYGTTDIQLQYIAPN